MIGIKKDPRILPSRGSSPLSPLYVVRGTRSSNRQGDGREIRRIEQYWPKSRIIGRGNRWDLSELHCTISSQILTQALSSPALYPHELCLCLVMSLTLTCIGFYTVSTTSSNQLILGPFHGKPACQTIAFGRGVCGTAAAEKRIIRVHDVKNFPGHIACDGESISEIVVPITSEGNVSSISVHLRIALAYCGEACCHH